MSTTSAPAVRPMMAAPRARPNSRPASGPECTRITATAADDPALRGAWATTAALNPDPMGASPMSTCGSSITGSLEVGAATARVTPAAPPRSGEAGSLVTIARATSPTVAVASAVMTMSTGAPC